MEKSSIFIIDDHPVIMHGVKSVLSKQPDMDIVGEAHDAESALKSLQKLQPDVIILDITLKGISGIDLIPRIKEKLNNSLIVIYSMHSTPNYIQRSIKAGAKGYVFKSDEIKDLIAAIRDVREGKMYLSRNIRPEFVEQILNGKSDGSSLSTLTPREYEVANLLVQGMTPDEIGESLFISPKTVRVHRTNIMHKLGCDRANALLLCLADHLPH